MRCNAGKTLSVFIISKIKTAFYDRIMYGAMPVREIVVCTRDASDRSSALRHFVGSIQSCKCDRTPGYVLSFTPRHSDHIIKAPSGYSKSDL